MRKYYDVHTGSDNFLNVINTDNGLAYDGFVLDMNTGEISVSDDWRENWQFVSDNFGDDISRNLAIFDYLMVSALHTSYDRDYELDETTLKIEIGEYTFSYTYTEESLLERLITYGKAKLILDNNDE